MSPTFAAAASVARELFAEFANLVASLPAEALDWRPLPGANSLAILAAHVATSTPFWFAVAAGVRDDLATYRRGERAAAFATEGVATAALLARLQQAAEDVGRLAALGNDASLGELVAWQDDDRSGPPLTRAEALFRAVSHLREHLGHAELTRELWWAHQELDAS